MPKQPPEVADAWERFTRTGDQRARAFLIAYYQPRVVQTRRRCFSSLSPAIAPADVEQAGLVELINAVDRFNTARGTQFETYADRMIHGGMSKYVSRTEWRYHGALHRVPLGDEEEEDETAAPDDPAGDAIAADQRAALLASLDNLPPADAELVRLIHFEELTLPQAARRLHRPRRDAETAYVAALASLKTMLEVTPAQHARPLNVRHLSPRAKRRRRRRFGQTMSFRTDRQTRELLQRLAQDAGDSEGAVIRQLIHEGAATRLPTEQPPAPVQPQR